MHVHVRAVVTCGYIPVLKATPLVNATRSIDGMDVFMYRGETPPFPGSTSLHLFTRCVSDGSPLSDAVRLSALGEQICQEEKMVRTRRSLKTSDTKHLTYIHPTRRAQIKSLKKRVDYLHR